VDSNDDAVAFVDFGFVLNQKLYFFLIV
jgi:hypothetical protein